MVMGGARAVAVGMSGANAEITRLFFVGLFLCGGWFGDWVCKWVFICFVCGVGRWMGDCVVELVCGWVAGWDVPHGDGTGGFQQAKDDKGEKFGGAGVEPHQPVGDGGEDEGTEEGERELGEELVE